MHFSRDSLEDRRSCREEMNPVSAPMVTEGNPARAAIEKVPVLAALYPQLQSAHTGILALRTVVEDPKVRELSAREAELDADHDDRVRGIYNSLTALAQVSSTGAELIRLRNMLFPDGLERTQRTYRGEAGHAAAVASRLDADTRARLRAVNLHDKNLLDLVNGWLGVAKQLGDLEEQRAQLMPTPSAQADINTARLAWIRVMNALVANAELAGLDADTDRLLFAALRAAEKTADARGRSKAHPAPAPVNPAK
jgi:hypothetical protein